jgi:prepilin-type N-terminal cleavage/methylation domain-containing protein
MKGNKRKSKKGFTLIELLVVIAIIAILSVVVILTLNPAELLRQSRDSNRISDLSVTKSAVAFYLASVTTPTIASPTAACYFSAPSSSINPTSTCAWFVNNGAYSMPTSTLSTSTNRQSFGTTTVDGLGWIPINFNSITAGGSPIGALPKDPLNTGDNYYTYIASNTLLQFKLATQMESAKYVSGGSGDVVTTDGGTSASVYEQGTNLGL